MKNEDILKNEIKREFPKMPETMRKMVEEEVGRQIKIERPEFSSQSSEAVMTRGRKWSMKKTAIVALAATMALGTTVFAGTKLYEIYSEKEGSYGLKTGIQVDVSQDSTEGGSGETNGEISGSDSYGKVPAEIPVVDIKINAIPEDMEAAEGEPGKLHRKDTPYQGGISMSTVAMDNEATKDQLELLDTNVVKSENMTIAGHDAVYMEKYNSDNIGITFDKKFYIVYPEVWHVLEVFVGEDMTKEEAVKVIESIELVPTGEMTDAAEAYTWSDMIAGQNGTEEIPGEAINVGDDKLTATAEEMKNVHAVGEAFSVNGDAETAEGEQITIMAKDNLLTARVKEVQVADDLSLLGDSEHIEDSWKDAVGADGKLVPNTIKYIKSGDGTNTLDEVVKTEEVNQKLVYITTEYTNTGDTELKNVMFLCMIPGIQEKNGEFSIYDRAVQGRENGIDCDAVSCSSVGKLGETYFYDVHGGERNNNYIPSIKPGETVVVHIAQIVNEDELPYMYLNMDLTGAAYEFTEESLAQGYVDIRQ